MSYEKEIVVFANSRKTSGRCIAGKELDEGRPGDWVRPVSSRPTQEVSEEERAFEDGSDPKLLDIVSIPCLEERPDPHQIENHLLDPDYYWSHEGRIDWQQLPSWCDSPEVLWNTEDSSSTGLNNRVARGYRGGVSLYLVQLDALDILVGPASDHPRAKRTVRAEFDYRGTPYQLAVTDPVIERDYRRRPNGTYPLANPFVCISLGDLYKGYYYKLVAAILHEARFQA